jgi:uncharacterized membrane protein
MIRYRLEIEIHKPIEQVTSLFINRDHLPKWQPGLLSSEQVESYPYPRYKLRFDFGRRKMEMTETIIRNELPHHFEGTYVMKGIHNHIHNSFEPSGPGATRWIYDTEFRFKGLMKIVALFMKDGLRKQSEMIMANFKRFAENN